MDTFGEMDIGNGLKTKKNIFGLKRIGQNKIKTEVGLMGIGSQIIKGIIGSQVIGVKRKSSDATENTRE